MNFYCDESCHLKSDSSKYMIIGTLYCEKKQARKISKNILFLKEKHNLSKNFEIKSTKVSSSKIDFYKELVAYFINEPNLKFRSIIIDKSELKHKEFNQTPDVWYYKMYYLLIDKCTLNDNNIVFMDYKDTKSAKHCFELSNILRNSYYGFKDFNVIPIDSKRSNLIQLSDLLIGLIGYKCNGLLQNKAKVELIDLIEKELKIKILKTNYIEKFNILHWHGRLNDA